MDAILVMYQKACILVLSMSTALQITFAVTTLSFIGLTFFTKGLFWRVLLMMPAAFLIGGLIDYYMLRDNAENLIVAAFVAWIIFAFDGRWTQVGPSFRRVQSFPFFTIQK